MKTHLKIYILALISLGLVFSTSVFAKSKLSDSLEIVSEELPSRLTLPKTLKLYKPFKVNRGWVSQKGKGFFKLAQNIIRSGRFYTPSGEIIDITTTSLYITNIYAEYGLTHRLTATLYLPFFFRSTLNSIRFEPSGDTQEGDALNSVGDINVGFKYGLIQNKPFVLSVGLTLGIPSGNPGGGNTQLLQSGDGEFNQFLELSAGYSLAGGKAYLGANVGINNRTSNFSEEFRYGFEAGYNFTKKFLGIVKVDGIESFMNGDAAGTANGIFSNDTEFLVITPEIIYTLKNNFGVTANVAAAVYGRRILASPSYSFGIFYKLDK